MGLCVSNVRRVVGWVFFQIITQVVNLEIIGGKDQHRSQKESKNKMDGLTATEVQQHIKYSAGVFEQHKKTIKNN